MRNKVEPTLEDLVAVLRESNARAKLVAADFAHTLAALDVVIARVRKLVELTSDAVTISECMELDAKNDPTVPWLLAAIDELHNEGAS